MKMIHEQFSCSVSKLESGEEGNPTTYNDNLQQSAYLK